jgi:hypothetical protein
MNALSNRAGLRDDNAPSRIPIIVKNTWEVILMKSIRLLHKMMEKSSGKRFYYSMSEKREISAQEKLSVRQEKLSHRLSAHMLIFKVFSAGITIADSKV